LVTADLFGMTGKKTAKFVKPYAQLHGVMQNALKQFKADVEEGRYPDDEHQYT